MVAPSIVPSIDAIISDLADAGQTLVTMHASEGAAGNLSVYLAATQSVPASYRDSEIIELPFAVPELAGSMFVVSGSGTRMRDIGKNPGGCLAILVIHPEGTKATLHYSSSRTFARITSEFNSHLAVHRSIARKHGVSFHALVHAQPRQLTYLSHLSDYQDFAYLNRQLLRWQPEAILNFPEGIAVVPFFPPSSPALMAANERALSEHRFVVWSKHGVMARSDKSVMAAVDLIEYAETAAAYECLDRSLGSRAPGLGPNDLKNIAQLYGIEQQLF